MNVRASLLAILLAAHSSQILSADDVRARLNAVQEQYRRRLSADFNRSDPKAIVAAATARRAECLQALKDFEKIDEAQLSDDEAIALNSLLGMAKEFEKQIAFCERNLYREKIAEPIQRSRVLAWIHLGEFREASTCLKQLDLAKAGEPLADLHFPLMGFLESAGMFELAKSHGDFGVNDLLVRLDKKPESLSLIGLWIKMYSRILRRRHPTGTIPELKELMTRVANTLGDGGSGFLSSCVCLEVVLRIGVDSPGSNEVVVTAIDDWARATLTASQHSTDQPIRGAMHVLQFLERDWRDYQDMPCISHLLEAVDRHFAHNEQPVAQFEQFEEQVLARCRQLKVRVKRPAPASSRLPE